MNDYAGDVAVANALVRPGNGRHRHAFTAPARSWRTRFWRLAVYFIALDVILAAVAGGLHLRRWMWIHTDVPYKSLRFDFDIENAHHWGSTILRHANAKALAAGNGGKATDWKYFLPAYYELYDQVMEEHPEGQYLLDYTPARLLVAALWVRHERLVYPHVTSWVRPYNYTAPLLWLNTICELLTALGAFLLVRHWVWRGTLPAGPRDPSARFPVPDRGWILGIVAALLIWFNPAILLDAHVFPQWEVWLLPSFFFAAWFASRGNWLTAGLVIPIGILMKGQLSMVLPLFILWPLLEGKPLAAAKFVAGMIIAAAVLLSPWLTHGSFAWFKVSFIYPAGHWQHMAGDSDNLPAILDMFGWGLADPVFTFRLPWRHMQSVVTIKTLLVSIYAVTLVLCSWGAARKSRRNDPAFLIALVAPWLLMFTLLTQMHERYLLWAAAASAITLAISVGWGLMHLLLTAIATSMILRSIMFFGKDRPEAPTLGRVLHGIHPGISWAVLVCAALFLYCAVAPNRRDKVEDWR
jgi:hypothetical protein